MPQFILRIIGLVWLSVFLFGVTTFAESREHVIYAFPECGFPDAPLVADIYGNLYGTALISGAYKNGCVFELSRENGEWKETTIYGFNGADGNGPAAGLVIDQSGNVYGTTMHGGVYGGGVAFELTPSSYGQWTETVLYNFGGPHDGSLPQGQLVLDKAGNLYGATEWGGQKRRGIVFELSPTPSGWTETILHAFAGPISGPGGNSPAGGIVMDSEGNLFGVTGLGGLYGEGMVYELKLKDGIYYKRTIHSFDGYDGASPNSLALGPDGNLYGTTFFGGMSSLCADCGVVFQLKKESHGQWTENTVLSLDGNDGAGTVGPPAFDDDGNLYAAAMSGGPWRAPYGAFGTVFRLTPHKNGSWTETTLHIFLDNFNHNIDPDGRSPYAGVIVVGNRLFGTTSSGGIHDEGTVFRIRLRPDADADEDSDDVEAETE